MKELILGGEIGMIKKRLYVMFVSACIKWLFILQLLALMLVTNVSWTQNLVKIEGQNLDISPNFKIEGKKLLQGCRYRVHQRL